jgi:3-deoxy-D-manno-octulosonate 8-phosphate phosphatase (KDO 8-P phosphatase)
MQKAGVTEKEVAYLVNDLSDIPLARRARLEVCVVNGAPELAAICHFTTPPGGHGAARKERASTSDSDAAVACA